MTATNYPMPLRDVLYAFSLAQLVPDARLLDEFVRRYPEHQCGDYRFRESSWLSMPREETTPMSRANRHAGLNRRGNANDTRKRTKG